MLCDKSFDGWIDGFKPDNYNTQIWQNDWSDDYPKNTLVKLHGSIDWYDNRGHKKYDKRNIHKYLDITGKKSLMIPLTKKDKNYDATPYKELFSKFEQIISKANLLVVIGYTFRDDKIYDTIYKYLNEKLHILFISPHAKDIINDILYRKPIPKNAITSKETNSINNFKIFDEPDDKNINRDVFKEANELLINKKDGKVYCDIYRESKVYYCDIKFGHETINDIVKLVKTMSISINSDELIPPISSSEKE